MFLGRAMRNFKIGLLVNPIAGIGGELAWKGTDDVDRAWSYLGEGNHGPVWGILERALTSLKDHINIHWVMAQQIPGISGTHVEPIPARSYSIDTRNAVSEIISHSIDLLVFVGGDGTAVDVASISKKIPVLGIPGGVKIFSPCFLLHPEDFGSFLNQWDGSTEEVDLFDLDEDAYREGRAIPMLVGSILKPISEMIQHGKLTYVTDNQDTYELISQRILEEKWLQERTILVGPGSTMRNIFNSLEMELSLLGVDLIVNGKVQGLDLTTKDLEKMPADEIWITPIGHQGHLFGRGNKQLSVKIIKSVGKKNIRIFSTPEKLKETPVFYVDTGNHLLDNGLLGFYSVIVGYYEEVIRKVV